MEGEVFLSADSHRQAFPGCTDSPTDNSDEALKPIEDGQNSPLDSRTPVCHYRTMLGEPQTPVLPYPQFSALMRVREASFLPAATGKKSLTAVMISNGNH